MEEETKKYRKYDAHSLRKAYDMVQTEGKTIYCAAKLNGIPWSTLKRYLQQEQPELCKMGRPFALPKEDELCLFNYIIEMQELGFGLTVLQVRKIAYDMAKAIGRENFLPSLKEIASSWWWGNFKERYGLCLRVPENLSAYRASMANAEMINDFYTKLDDLVTKLGIKDKPDLMWNCDETGMSYVVKPSRVVTAIGKKYVYQRTYAERGQTQTLLACVCANGTWLPPMIIFKGIRWNDSLKTDALPNSLIKLSPKGWINSELFFEWLTFFIAAIPPARPVVLLMDSHSAHIGPKVLELAKLNQIYLMTFPAHCTHILQPLDVGVFKSLKSYWRKSMTNYMTDNPSDAPNRSNFHAILNPAFIKSVRARNIINAFKKSGTCPINPNAVSKEALKPSALTDRPMTNNPGDQISSNNSAIDLVDAATKTPAHAILKMPQPSAKKTTKTKRDSSAKCLTPVENILPGPSRSVNVEKQKKNRKEGKHDEEWECGLCERLYSKEVKKKNGAEWIQCSYCLTPYHENCLDINDMDVTEQLYFRCDNCI